MRGNAIGVLAVVCLVAGATLLVYGYQGTGWECTIDVTVNLYRRVENTSRWDVAAGEEVEIEAFIEWSPNSRAPDAEVVASSNANGVARASLVIHRPGEFTVFARWGGEWEGRVIEVSEEDDGRTLAIGIEMYEGGLW